MVVPRRGNQEPTFSTVGRWSYTDGDYAVRMFGEYGIRFYESQAYELHVFLARNEDGSFAAKTICISKPRQNGKSFAARFYAIWMAAICGLNVLYTAHHGKTARKMFKAIRAFVEGNSEFAAMLKPNGQGIYAAKGSEGIYFVDEDGNDAGMIEFQTRTNGGGRGDTCHVIIVDEAQELTEDQLEAIKPTTFAAGEVDDPTADPQMIYLGTPPGPKCPGTKFRDYHDRAHSEPDTTIWWMEWAVESVPDMTDKEAVMELVYLTNPAMGYRIKESTMRDAIDTMSADGFSRECLGWWSGRVARVAVIGAESWDACAVNVGDIPSQDEGRVAYAVKFAADGSTGALAACINPDIGKPYVQLIAYRSMGGGVGWFEDWLVPREEKAAVIVIDGGSYSGALVERLLAADFAKDQLETPKSGDVAKACGMLVDAVESRELKHGAQEDLDGSATHCRKRKIGTGGGFGFESAGEYDSVIVEACALALWQALTTTRDQRREGLVG